MRGALIALTLFASPAWASCGPEEQIAGKLALLYSERPVAVGETRDQYGHLLKVTLWTSKSGTATLTYTSAAGLTCLVSSITGLTFLGNPEPEAGEEM